MGRNTMIDLKNKVALVTGASRGIGLAVARKLSACGAAVVLAARSVSGTETAASEIAAEGGKAIGTACDVSQYGDVTAAVDLSVQTFGGLDILINNAGVIDPISHMADSDPDAWDLAIDINVKGVYHGMRAAIPVMEQTGGGVIVNLSSGAAVNALEGWSHYCASKAAVKMLTQCAQNEYGAKGIRVVGLSPGTVATDMMATIKDSGVNRVSQLDWSTHIPTEWVGEAVAYLCGPGGADFAGTDFSIKSDEGRKRVGLPPV